MRRLHSTDGAALLIALMAMMLMATLATALMLTTMTETRIAASYGAGIEAYYAADAAVERAIADLRTAPDWSVLVAMAAPSTFVDGPPEGRRTRWDGAILDLVEETRLAREGDTPGWRLFAYGALDGVLPPGRLRSRAYVVVWVADSPDAPAEQGEETLELLAQAYAPHRARRTVRVTLSRNRIGEPEGILVISRHDSP